MNFLNTLHSFVDGKQGNDIQALFHPQAQQPVGAAPGAPPAVMMGQMPPIDPNNGLAAGVAAGMAAGQTQQAIPQPPHGGLAGKLAKIFMGGA